MLCLTSYLSSGPRPPELSCQQLLPVAGQADHVTKSEEGSSKDGQEEGRREVRFRRGADLTKLYFFAATVDAAKFTDLSVTNFEDWVL